MMLQVGMSEFCDSVHTELANVLRINQAAPTL